MRKTMFLAALAAMALASAADAKTCRDASGHRIKCAAVATSTAVAPSTATPAKPAKHSLFGLRKSKTTAPAAPASPAPLTTATAASPTSGYVPHCTKGKPCGHSCIAMSKVCHKQ